MDILLVEDNPADVRLIEEVLRDAGATKHRMQHESRLERALQSLALARPDVVLLDMNLPDSLGVDTVARMQAAGPELPIVVLTGYDDDGTAVDALRMGAQDYLVKGQIDARRLVRAIDYAVERKRSEQELRRMHHALQAHAEALQVAKEAAEAAARVKSTILANLSHEIRTPLTAIIGFAQVLAEEVGGVQRQHAETIWKSGRRLLDTLNSVLELAQLEAGGVALRAARVDVASLVREGLVLFAHEAARKHVALHLFCPGALEATMDPVLMQRILANLVSNAVKFTESGTVEVRLEAEEGWLRLEVSDTGIGISTGFQRSMFEAFTQESVGLARAYSGNGLGLALTRHLVELMEGTIAVSSEQGRGSRFVVCLPAAAAARGAVQLQRLDV
jgi:signal transduction histidine kinase